MKTEISPTATALVALMKLKGLGRRGALKIVDNTIRDIPFSDHCEALSLWLSHYDSNVSKSEFAEIWAKSLEQLNRNQKAGIQVFSFHDEKYPKHLRGIPDPPAVLFVKGKTEGLHSTERLAIIGTRKPTQYGEKVAHKSARTAAEKGFVIVSGLAYGCDTHAHEGCLEAGGVGIAVLAHGLDKVYPAATRDLANRLVEQGGCLVSEYPVGLKPARSAFVERDRIQSGLSEAILVIETGIKGGTMHTIRFARDQKRPLACIDYTEQLSVQNKAKGNRKLIEDGDATPIRDGKELMQFLDGIKSLESGKSVVEKSNDAVDHSQLSLAFPE